MIIEESAEIKDMLDNEERKKLGSANKNFSERLESIIKEVKPKRTNADSLDKNIMARISGINSVLEEIMKSVNLSFSRTKQIEKAQGFDTLINSAPPIKEYMQSQRDIIKDQIVQIFYLKVIIDYILREKDILLELLVDVKDAEIEIQLFEKMEKMYTGQITTLQRQIDKLMGIAENSVSEGEIKIANSFRKPINQKEVDNVADDEQQEEQQEEKQEMGDLA